jgi:hypothetical protein
MGECQVFAWGMELSAWSKKVTEREALLRPLRQAQCPMLPERSTELTPKSAKRVEGSTHHDVIEATLDFSGMRKYLRTKL